MKFDVSLTSQLSSKGSDVTKSVSLTETKDVQTQILRWLADLIKDMQGAIDKYDAKATLNLRQSFAASPFKLNGNQLSIDLEGADYWKFVNYGVNGVQNNRGRPYSFRSIQPSAQDVADIRKWIVDKALGIPADELDGAAYNIARAIKRRGIEPRPFYTDTMTDKRVNELTVTIADITGKQISLKLLSTFEK